MPFRILALDGGGAKGVYTLGVLAEVEAHLQKPLSQHFDLIFGTSTGAIIAALLGKGVAVEQIHRLYKEHVPTVMMAGSEWFPNLAFSRRAKSNALAKLADDIFQAEKFDVFQTGVALVAANWKDEQPFIFKNNIAQAHAMRASFSPGWGCTVSDAVQASCSAYPFFERKTIVKNNGDVVDAVDGGYCANNPTLYALADALKPLAKAPEDIRILNVGVGSYPEPQKPWTVRLINRFEAVQLLQKTININTLSMERLRAVMFGHIQTIRVSETFSAPELATDFLEHDPGKLNRLHQQGRASFGRHEASIVELLA
jgi:patatin-like phospholipase/acyl hydrolase